MIGQSQVLHGKWKALAWIAVGGGAVAQRGRGAGDGKRITARIGTLAPVAATAQRLRGKQAQAAVGIAQRSVNEDFRFDAGRGRDVAHFLEGQFASQDDTGEAK